MNPAQMEARRWSALDVNSTVQDVVTENAYITHVMLVNNDNATRYVQFFNQANGDVVLGTTDSQWIPVPAGPGGITLLDLPFGYSALGPAISIAATTTPTGAVNVTNNMYALVLYTLAKG